MSKIWRFIRFCNLIKLSCTYLFSKVIEKWMQMQTKLYLKRLKTIKPISLFKTVATENKSSNYQLWICWNLLKFIKEKIIFASSRPRGELQIAWLMTPNEGKKKKYWFFFKVNANKMQNIYPPKQNSLCTKVILYCVHTVFDISILHFKISKTSQRKQLKDIKDFCDFYYIIDFRFAYSFINWQWRPSLENWASKSKAILRAKRDSGHGGTL